MNVECITRKPELSSGLNLMHNFWLNKESKNVKIKVVLVRRKQHMKKRKIFSLLAVSIILSSAGLTGCAKAVPLDNTQQDMVAEYCAQLVLRYDANYEGKLKRIKETTQSESKDDKKNENVNEETTRIQDVENATEEVTAQKYEEKELSLSEAFGIDSVDIQYTGFNVADSYSDGTANPADLVPGEGHSFLIEKFQMTNTGGGILDIPMMSFDKSIKSNVNGKQYTALITLLMNALNTYTGTLQPGQSVEVVLVYEINSINESDITDLELEVTENDRKATFKLK